MSQGKVKSLAMLFNSFPALTWSVEATRAKVETYLSVLEIYSDDQVRAACQNIMRHDRAFPPSAGELRAECERVTVSMLPPVSRDRNLPPPDKRTDEEKAASRARVAKIYAEWKAGLPASDAGLAKAVGGMFGVSEPDKKAGPVAVSGSLMERLTTMGLAEPESADDYDKPAF